MQNSIRPVRAGKSDIGVIRSRRARRPPQRDRGLDSALAQESGLCAYADMPRGCGERGSRSVGKDSRPGSSAIAALDGAQAKRRTRDAYWEWNLLQ